MTKEELKKEAEEKAFNYADEQDVSTSMWVDKDYTYIQVVNAYEKGALDFAEPREKRIAELEKKLGFAKQDVEMYEKTFKEFDKKVEQLVKENEQKDKRLTKATELIRDLLSCLYSVEYDRVSDLEEAEQFIKDLEK